MEFGTALGARHGAMKTTSLIDWANRSKEPEYFPAKGPFVLNTAYQETDAPGDAHSDWKLLGLTSIKLAEDDSLIIAVVLFDVSVAFPLPLKLELPDHPSTWL